MSSDEVRAIWSDQELDTALATLRADVTTDRARLDTGRAALLAAAASPVPQDEVVPVVDQLTGSGDGARPGSVGRGRQRLWWLASAAAVVLVAAGIVVVQQVGGEANPAAARLELAADNVRDSALAPGQYRYVSRHGWDLTMLGLDETWVRVEQDIRTWVPADPRDDWTTRMACLGATSLENGEPLPPGGGCATEPLERVQPCGGFPTIADPTAGCAREGDWLTPDEEFLDALPRDPDALRDRLLADLAASRADLFDVPVPEESDPTEQVLSRAGKLLATGVVPADLRAATYRMLARLPSIEVTEENASLDGREGTAFGVTDGGIRTEVVIDQDTGEFVGTREVYVETVQSVATIREGTVFYEAVSTAVVDGVGREPS